MLTPVPTVRAGVLVALALVAVCPGRGQTVDAVDAVSRPVLVRNTAGDAAAASASSRQWLVLAGGATDATGAVSREALLLNARTDVAYDDTVSREYLVLLPPYGVPDIRQAVALAAGIAAAGGADLSRLNIVRDGESAARLDLRDAVRITRLAMGLDPY